MSEATVGTVAVTKPLAERMRERVVEAVGDLLSKEELQQMTEAAVKEIFFTGKPAVMGDGSYYCPRDRVMTPAVDPLITGVAKQLIAPFVERQVKAYLADNEEQVLKMVKDVVDKGAETIVLQAIQGAFNKPMVDMLMSVQANLGKSMAADGGSGTRIIGYSNNGQPIFGN